MTRLVSTGISSLDKILSGEGYPERTAILVVGAPGVGKEVLGYWFIHSGLAQGDFCNYVTRLPVREILRDARGFGMDFKETKPFFMASDGGQVKYDHHDLIALSVSIKGILKQNANRKIRIVFDAISPLLIQNSAETVYNFLSQLFSEIKNEYDAVVLATLEDGMHPPQVITAMQQLFDGVIEFKFYEDGLRIVPLLRIRKMTGMPPQPGYFGFSISDKGMDLTMLNLQIMK
jgi:circadian clock protein KaiC